MLPSLLQLPYTGIGAPKFHTLIHTSIIAQKMLPHSRLGMVQVMLQVVRYPKNKSMVYILIRDDKGISVVESMFFPPTVEGSWFILRNHGRIMTHLPPWPVRRTSWSPAHRGLTWRGATWTCGILWFGILLRTAPNSSNGSGVDKSG